MTNKFENGLFIFRRSLKIISNKKFTLCGVIISHILVIFLLPLAQNNIMLV